jgi:hypothetical protein
LNYLKEEGHPLIEGLVQAEVYQFVVNTIGPTYGSKTEIENVQKLLSSMACDFFTREG